MNVYSIAKGQAVSADLLTAISLGAFLGNEMDVQKTDIRLECEFSLSNLNSGIFDLLIFSSPFQNVIENFDKPVVETGDIVVVAVPNSKLPKAKQFFDNYAQIVAFFADQPVVGGAEGETEKVHLLYGVSNSTNTDFFEPFAGFERVAFHQDKIVSIAEALGIDPNDEWDEFAEMVVAQAVNEAVNAVKS